MIKTAGGLPGHTPPAVGAGAMVCPGDRLLLRPQFDQPLAHERIIPGGVARGIGFAGAGDEAIDRAAAEVVDAGAGPRARPLTYSWASSALPSQPRLLIL